MQADEAWLLPGPVALATYQIVSGVPAPAAITESEAQAWTSCLHRRRIGGQKLAEEDFTCKAASA